MRGKIPRFPNMKQPTSPARVARRLLVCAVGATKAVLQRAAAPVSWFRV